MSDTDSAPQGKPAPSDSEASDPGYRSRSQSRRSRRRKQQNQKPQQQQKPQTIEEDPEPEPEPEDTMQPFNHIGPDETSMDGPVTYARAQRGEISKREGNPNQALKTGKGDKGGESKMMEQDGLKLRLELNLDVEIELKARIQGDLTIALLA